MNPYPEYKSTDLDWLPRVPAHWEVKRAKFVFKTINERSKTGEEELLSVSHITGVTKRKANVTMFKAESYVGYKVCQPNDLVINSMWAWMGALGIAPLNGIVSTAYSVYRMDESQLAPRFAGFLLRIKWYAQDFENRSKGIWTSRLMLSDDAFGNVLLALPPLDEQAQIVRYLGAKHREIESYIAAKRSLLVRLNELSAATISRAVTRGLNPDVAVKPSGVEWLGDVPEHWTRLPVKRLVKTKITDGPHETPEIVDEGIPFLSAESVKNGIVDFNLRRGFITKELHEVFCRKCRPQRDDIFMVKSGATTGKTAIVETDEEFSIWSPLALIRANEKLILPRFLFHAIREESFQKQVQLSWSFGTQQNIGMGVIEKLFVNVPPLDEQAAIVAYLENQLAIIGEARGRIEREITLAGELYQTLVANVVTGQFDVSGVVVDFDGAEVELDQSNVEFDGADVELDEADVELVE